MGAAESMSPAALGAAVLAICFKIAELCVSVADHVAKEDTELKICVTRLLAATQPATTRMHRQECIQVWALNSTGLRYFCLTAVALLFALFCCSLRDCCALLHCA